MPSVSNDTIAIEVAIKGAELQSIYNKQNGLQYLWSGDPAYWGKHSPVLFPIVGELKNKSYLHKGKAYELSRHGFARDMNFEVTEEDGSSITLSLESSEQTLQVYPFPFKLSITYLLRGNILEIQFLVLNTGEEKMFFSLGGHPAFKIPLVDGTAFEDYQLVFEEKESVGRWPITPEGLLETNPVPLLQNQDVLPLKKELFTSDAIVLKGLRSKSVSIKSAKTTHGVKVDFDNFPYLGIWETKGGDFVCIEPWCGIADSVDATGNIAEKEGINSLNSGEKFAVGYRVELF
jgi:galactose mutarotase-like enzyme